MQAGRAGTIGIAAMILTLSLTCSARAVQTNITPNAAIISYSLANGTSTGPITPPASQSVLVMGVCLTSGFRGVGHVSMLRINNSFLEWVGQNSASSGATVQGFSGTAGTRIVQIDFSGGVWIAVDSANSFRVTNTSGGSRFGNVTLIW